MATLRNSLRLMSSRSILRVVSGGLRELIARPSSQMPGLDALRAIAVLLVIGDHYVVGAYQAAGGADVALAQSPLFTLGWTGVDLFFVLSGFLIGRQLWREFERSGTVRVGRFLLRRGLRIWPLYFATLAALALFHPELQIRTADWLFLTNYTWGGLSRGWSLSTEEQFYIALPVLLVLLGTRVPLRRWPWVLGGIAVTLLALRGAIYWRTLHDCILYSHAGYRLNYPIHVHADALLLGALIALASVLRPDWFAREGKEPFARWAFLIMLGAIELAFFLHTLQRETFAFAALALIFGGITLFVLLDRSALTRPLRAWIFYPISRLSYGMYLNHFLFASGVVAFVVPSLLRLTGSPKISFLGGLLAGTLVSIAVAVLTFVLIEHPFLLLRERLFAERRAAEAARGPAHGPGRAPTPRRQVAIVDTPVLVPVALEGRMAAADASLGALRPELGVTDSPTPRDGEPAGS